jgi:hypothetical protein
MSKIIIVGSTGGAITPKMWKRLMETLEEKGYLWRGGSKPTQKNKCPMERCRYIHLGDNKTFTFGESWHEIGVELVKVTDFIKSQEK